MTFSRLMAVSTVFAVVCGAHAGATSGSSCDLTQPKRNTTASEWRGKGWWMKRHAAKLQEIEKSGGEIDLVFIGDSITHQWETVGAKEYAKICGKYSVLNIGFGGDSSDHVLWRGLHGELDGYRAKCVMLMIGTNSRKYSAEDVTAGILADVKLIREKQPQAKVLLLPIFPTNEKPDNWVRVKHDKVNAAVKAAAVDGRHVFWLDFGNRFLEKDGTLTRRMMSDLIHPTEIGYAIWRQAIMPFFEQHVKNPRPFPHDDIRVVFPAGRTEVVVSADASPATRLAACEMTNLLGKVFGGDVPLVGRRTPGRMAITLDGRAEGLARDAFRIVAGKDGVRIEGRDSEERSPESIVKLPGEMEWGPQYERATMFGCYEFLERYAGCRFYFPGELGTVTPRADAVSVPCGTVSRAPVFTVRRYGYSDGAVPEEILAEYGGSAMRAKRAMFYRLRMETEYLQCCHGLKKFRLLQRFGGSHPEYFCQGADGRRLNEEGKYRAGLLCFSSAVTNEIYEDARAYLEGAPVSSRYAIKMRRWPLAFQGRVVDVMSQDDFAPCHCERCQAAYDFSRGGSKGNNYATEQIWRFTVALADRLQKAGVKDFSLTQMAYCPYADVPSIDIPECIRVMVAVQGPWSIYDKAGYTADVARIRGWNAKLGRKTWLWTYPGKAMARKIPGAPTVSPRAWGKFFQDIADDIEGAFAESETERWFHHYLNYYVFSRIAWNPFVDVDAILDEHYTLLFGPAAKDMKAIYEALEDKWVKEVSGAVQDTPVGPVATLPSDSVIWRKAYSESFIGRCATVLAAALSKVEPGSLEARRIALVQKEYFDPLVAARAAAIPQIEADEGTPVFAHSAKRDQKPFRVRPTNWLGTKVIKDQLADGWVTVEKAAREIVVKYKCNEPRQADAVAPTANPDTAEIALGDSIEFYIDPDCSRQTYYRFIVGRNGLFADAVGVKPRTTSRTKWNYAWNSRAKVSAKTTAEGWACEVRIPLAAMPGLEDRIAANFCRNRILKGEPAVTRHYLWGPGVRNYEDLRRFTTIILDGDD